MKKEILPPYKSGYFKTSGGHQLYYELWGNPKGKPAIYLHGGPGLGMYKEDTRFFDHKTWNVLLFDQRGAGKSTPFANMENNTTQELVADIKKLMDFAGFKKALLFGGSWGSTLALTFAINHPQRVTALVLRGIWLVTKEEYKYYVQGGIAAHYPDVWERFLAIVPEAHHKDPLKYYYEKMRNGTNKQKELYAYEFAYFETSIYKMKLTGKKVDEALAKDPSWKTLGPIEVHYTVNNCFLPENFILENIGKIAHIPTAIIHGRFDMICQPYIAYTLHKKLPNSRLFFTLAGHSSGEKANEKRLIAEVKRFAKIV